MCPIDGIDEDLQVWCSPHRHRCYVPIKCMLVYFAGSYIVVRIFPTLSLALLINMLAGCIIVSLDGIDEGHLLREWLRSA